MGSTRMEHKHFSHGNRFLSEKYLSLGRDLSLPSDTLGVYLQARVPSPERPAFNENKCYLHIKHSVAAYISIKSPNCFE